MLLPSLTPFCSFHSGARRITHMASRKFLTDCLRSPLATSYRIKEANEEMNRITSSPVKAEISRSFLIGWRFASTDFFLNSTTASYRSSSFFRRQDGKSLLRRSEQAISDGLENIGGTWREVRTYLRISAEPLRIWYIFKGWYLNLLYVFFTYNYVSSYMHCHA